MTFAELQVGQSAEFTRTVTEGDVMTFADITGDRNPLHLDEERARLSRFGGRIAHGLLSAGFISACLSMRLPGPRTIYLSQSLRFTRPVRIDDTVTARVEVVELIPDKRRVRLATTCRNQHNELLIEGEATVLVPDEGDGVPEAGARASAAPASAGGVAGPAAPDQPGGRFIDGTFTNAAGERRYKLYVPDGDAGARKRPLVVMLHGCTQDAGDLARGTRMNELADTRGWMVLYPEQPAAAHGRKCWNWYDVAHQQRDAGEPSIIADLTARVAANYRADPRRVYLAGVSAGAAMASLVAAAYPEQYVALALHSGLVHGAAHDVMSALGVMQNGVTDVGQHAQSAVDAMGRRRRVIPTLVIHGVSDAVVAPINGAQAAEQWVRSNLLTLDRHTTGELQPEVTTSSEQGVTMTISTGGGWRDAHVTLMMVDGLGHAWSGGSSAGTFTDPRGPAASGWLLDFFADHTGP